VTSLVLCTGGSWSVMKLTSRPHLVSPFGIRGDLTLSSQANCTWQTTAVCELLVAQAVKALPSSHGNHKIHRRIHKNPPSVPILCQMKPLLTHPLQLLRFYLILSSRLHLGLSSGLFSLVSRPNLLLVFFYFVILTTFGQEYDLRIFCFLLTVLAVHPS
jgi:hypothetical protein